MKKTKEDEIDLRKIKRKVLFFSLICLIVIGAALFLPAGSLDYWQAWAFMGTLFIPFAFVVSYFLKRDPRFLQRRMQFKEKQVSERGIMRVALLLFIAGFIFPGLDHRYGWSSVSTAVVIVSDAIIFLSYMLVFRVFKENSYASRIVEVEKGQKVVTTGPYSVVRHPMYAGVIPMYLAVPVALASYWALLFFVPVVFVIIFRIFDEERLLLRELKGYKEYTKKVKYRLLPGVW